MSGDERPPRPAVDAIPAALAEGELEVIGLLPRASNASFLARAGGGPLVVYKPRRGETPLWDFPDGTLCLREVAAYEVARALGWPNVPSTVLREGPYGEGSVQAFVEPQGGHHYFTLAEAMPDEFRRVALFDAVVNNADRKSGHCILGSDGRVWVVDHGVCFAEEDKLRTVIWEFAAEPVPGPLLDDLRRVRERLGGGELAARLAPLLEPAELEATRSRIARILEERTFPTPGPARHVPWPPV